MGISDFRIGNGYDVHKLVSGRELILGGVRVPFGKGLSGHSDADVLLHAISDALLGALALGDIGKFFPDTDAKYKNIDSRILLRESHKLVADKGYRVVNIDTVIVAQQPKLAPYIPDMKHNIAEDVRISPDDVSIKATTSEGLGFTGRGEGISAYCVTLLKKHD